MKLSERAERELISEIGRDYDRRGQVDLKVDRMNRIYEALERELVDENKALRARIAELENQR
jgi:hypothetical protein